MPPLPKKRQHKEADVTPLVLEWFKKNYHHSCALEIKIKGNKLLKHQEVALRKVSQGKYAHKMPDMGRRMPFDAFVLINADAILVTCDGRHCTCEVYNGGTFAIKV